MNWRGWAIILTIVWIAALAAYNGLLYGRIDEDFGMYGTLTVTLLIVMALVGLWWWAYACAREDALASRGSDISFRYNRMNNGALGAMAGGTTVSLMLFVVNPFFKDNFGPGAQYIAAGILIAALVLIWLVYLIIGRRKRAAQRPPTI